MLFITSAGILNSSMISSSFDADAQAYFTATGITDATVQSGINQLVLDLKSNSIWTKMNVIFPFPDANSTHCLYNLKDATLLASLVGTPTFASTGMTPSTGNYIDTNYNDNSLTFNDAHMSFYSRTDDASVEQWLMGTNSSSGGTGTIEETTLVNVTTRQMFSVFFTGTAATNSGTYANTRGLYTSSTQSGTLKIFRNGSDITTNPVGGGTLVNGHRGQTFLIGFIRGQTTPTCEIAFGTIGLGLTATDVSNLYTAIQTYQTTLSRQVT